MTILSRRVVGGGLTSPAAAVLHAKASLHWDLLTDQKIMAIPLLRQIHARGPTNVQTESSTKELKTQNSTMKSKKKVRKKKKKSRLQNKF